ncbi:hypothetical protein JCM10213v2_003675 [Rhodosporidiobolus nylandii]
MSAAFVALSARSDPFSKELFNEWEDQVVEALRFSLNAYTAAPKPEVRQEIRSEFVKVVEAAQEGALVCSRGNSNLPLPDDPAHFPELCKLVEKAIKKHRLQHAPSPFTWRGGRDIEQYWRTARNDPFESASVGLTEWSMRHHAEEHRKREERERGNRYDRRSRSPGPAVKLERRERSRSPLVKREPALASEPYIKKEESEDSLGLVRLSRRQRANYGQRYAMGAGGF